MKKTLILLVLTVLISGCSKDDTNDSEKMVFKSETRHTQTVTYEDKTILIADPSPTELAPVASQGYCPNPNHTNPEFRLQSGIESSYIFIYCAVCNSYFYSNGKPANEKAKELNLNIKTYNIKYDDSIKSYIIW